MDAAQKSFELQNQVRQNAEVVKNTLNALYNWEKEIKNKEKEIQKQPEIKMDKENMVTFLCEKIIFYTNFVSTTRHCRYAVTLRSRIPKNLLSILALIPRPVL